MRFDPSSKLWIYLHGKRTLDSVKWITGMTEGAKKAVEKHLDKYSGGAGTVPREGKGSGTNPGTNDTTDVSHSHGYPLSQEND